SSKSSSRSSSSSSSRSSSSSSSSSSPSSSSRAALGEAASSGKLPGGNHHGTSGSPSDREGFNIMPANIRLVLNYAGNEIRPRRLSTLVLGKESHRDSKVLSS